MVGPALVPNATASMKSTATFKLLCSYGGKIIPRYPDGKLRYFGGHTRVLAVDRSVSFPELLVKLGELCGTSVSLRCQLPMEDLDALVSIKSEEDLANLIEEYDRVGPSFRTLKIRAFLSVPRSAKKASPPPSDASYSPKSLSPKSMLSSVGSPSRFSMPPLAAVHRCIHRMPTTRPICCENSVGKITHCGYHRDHAAPGRIYLIHSGNYWQ